jgi:hypothetical protein
VFPGVSTSAVRGATGSGGTPVRVQPVVITTTGSTFSPWLQATQGVTVTWTWSGGSATGLLPSINFGSAATRTVTMTATIPGGYNALNQIRMFNIGYDHTNDPGYDSLSSAYDWPAQSVAGISGISSMSGLVLFLAEGIPALAGVADFTGMSRLTHVDSYGSSFSKAIFSGCTSLLRCDVELNDIVPSNSFLDLNPVAGNVYDLRAAHQNAGIGGMTFTPLRSPLAGLYHFCVRDQQITNMPDLATQLPVVVQLWIYNCGQSGAFTPVSASLFDILAYSNSYSSADLTNQFPTPAQPVPPASTTSVPRLDLHSNSLTSCTLTGCPALLAIDLSSNLLPQAQVDSVLATVDGFATSSGTLNLGGTGNATPSAAGLTSKTNLTGRGWTVTTN